MTSQSTVKRPAPGVARAVYALVLLCLINAFSYLDRNMIGLLLPQMTAELELSDTITGLVAGLPFAMCYAFCAIPAAWIADTRNRRNLLVIALTVWSTITALSGLVQNGWQLAIARFGLGAGESPGHPTTSSLVADLFSAERRTIAFSALSASAYLGPLIGFPVIGWILAEHGWRTSFFVMGLGGLVFAGLLLFTVKEPPRGASAKSSAVEVEPAQTFVSGVKLLFSTRSYPYVVFAGALNAVNQGAHMTWGPTFLDRVHDLGPQEIGFYFGTLRGIAGLAGAFSTALVVGALVRRDIAWQIRAPIIIAILPFFGDAIFLFSRDPIFWQVGLALSALSTAMVVAVSYSLYVNIVPPRLRAQAAAFYFVVAMMTGMVLGPFVVGALSDALAPTLGVESITWGMLVGSSSAIVSCVLLIFARRTWVEDMKRAEGM